MVADNLIEALLNSKLEVDCVEEALQMVINLPEEDKRVLVQLRDSAYEEYSNACSKVLKKMSKDSNCASLNDGWYAVRYKSDGTEGLRVVPVAEKDIFLIERTGAKARDLSESELTSLLAGCRDTAKWEVYLNTLTTKANQLLRAYLGVDLRSGDMCPAPEGVGVRVAVHAGIRYVQRELGIVNETKARDYRMSHLCEVEACVLSGFSKAKKVWQEDGGIEYWFDERNIMYVVGRAEQVVTIITLYEENFGWDKDRNRMLVELQLKTLEEVRSEVMEAESTHYSVDESFRQEVLDVNSQIDVLQAQITLLNGRRATIEASRQESARKVALAKQKYNQAFNKLFEPWEVKQ